MRVAADDAERKEQIGVPEGRDILILNPQVNSGCICLLHAVLA